MRRVNDGVPCDAQLVALAEAGDTRSLGMLLERYRPALYARALRILGYNDRAEDAVQDTFVVALMKMRDIRNTAAFGGWLYRVLTNVCLMRLRENGREIMMPQAPDHARPVTGTASVHPEDHLDRLLAKGEVWRSIGELSENLAVTLMLRYFSSYCSYEEIAMVLSIPVGTVRSRLSQAKRKLLAHVQAQSTQAGAFPASTVLSNRNLHELFCRLHQEQAKLLPAFFAEDLELVFVHPHEESAHVGRARWREEILGDLDAGTVFQPQSAVGTGNLAIVEGRIDSPSDNPLGCPPRAVAVLRHERDVIRSMRIYFAPMVSRRRPDAHGARSAS